MANTGYIPLHVYVKNKDHYAQYRCTIELIYRTGKHKKIIEKELYTANFVDGNHNIQVRFTDLTNEVFDTQTRVKVYWNTGASFTKPRNPYKD